MIVVRANAASTDASSAVADNGKIKRGFDGKTLRNQIILGMCSLMRRLPMVH